jgi:hypothetical protein
MMEKSEIIIANLTPFARRASRREILQQFRIGANVLR